MGRLKPVRAGIVNLWDYTDHKFAFHGGRLVLRGPNGSGKTKALELLFPFLLDASLSPQRLDPFSGTGRTMHDNLLYRPGRETVIGYAWMEFSDGDGNTWVLGAGLRGQRARSDVKSWFFVTDRPYGDGWSVLDESDQPLAENRLADLLGPTSVFSTASSYRERVDAVLFGEVGSDRYAALIHLVLFLRRPQLAKDLNLALLSDTLSAGLRPVDEEKVRDAALSFDDLEKVQKELERIQQACAAVEGFLRSYRPYVRVVARQRTDAVLAAQRTERAAAREILQSKQRFAAADQEHQFAQQSLREALAEDARLRGERDTQIRSEAYQSSGQLEDLRRAVETSKRVLAEALHEIQRRSERLAEEQIRTDTADTDVEIAVRALAIAFQKLRADAGRVVPNRIAQIDALEGSDDPTPAGTALLRERREDLRAVRQLLNVADRAASDADRADEEVLNASLAVEEAQQSLVAAESALADARNALFAAVQTWAALWDWVDASLILALQDMARVGEPPALKQVALQGSNTVRHSIADVLAELTQSQTNEHARRAELQNELQRVNAEHDDAPPVPPVLRRDRTLAAGAPLWRLVDFAPGVDDADQAGVEAALLAAGLLDAWVTPDGAVSEPSVFDSFLTPHEAASDASGFPEARSATLADLLVPDADSMSDVPAPTVLAVLRSIGVGRIGVSVDTSGAFALGPLVGRTTKERAEYIGTSARAARRVRRAKEISAQIIACEAVLADLKEKQDEQLRRRAALDASIDALPSEASVADALRVAEGEARAVRDRRKELAARSAAAHDSAIRRRSANEALVDLARDRSIPHDPEDLETFDQSLASFESAVSEMSRSHERRRSALEKRAAAVEALELTKSDLVQMRHVCDVREAEASRTEAEYNTLFDTVGTDAKLVQETLQFLDNEIRSQGEVLNAARQRTETTVAGLTRADIDAGRATGVHRQTVEAVTATLERLKVLRRPELRAALNVEDTSDLEAFVPVLGAACKDTVATDEQRQARKTGVRNAFQTMENQLGARYHAALDDADDIDVVMVENEDGRFSVAAFADLITRRRDEKRLLLSEQERQVLEDTLVDSLCRQLFQRLRDAEEQVKRMNNALAERRTTSGTGVQLSWTASDAASDDQRQLVKLLERDPGLMGTDDRALLREALAAEIKHTRAADGRSGYHDVLAKVLDYRTWRRFGIKLMEKDGTISTLTKGVFNKKSGGEKATILHLPLFAAAAAHFDAAAPWAPRLVALDEAFAGIDAGTTRELLALTVQFDLDVFLTGHDFWGAVAEVPQLSIVTLSHHRDSHTVAALNGRWDGTELTFEE